MADANAQFLKEIPGYYKYATDLSAVVSITDAQGVIKFVNDRFVKTYGIPKEEIIGKTHNVIRYADVPAEFYKEFWENISSKKVWRGKFKNKSSNGNMVIMDCYVIPVLDKAKNVKEYISIQRDVTAYEADKKKREKQMLKTRMDMMAKIKQEQAKFTQQVQELELRVKQLNNERNKAVSESEKFKSKALVLNQKLRDVKFMVSFENVLQAEAERARRYRRPLSIVIFGIDKIEGFEATLDGDHLLEQMLFKYKSLVQDSLRLCDFLVKDSNSHAFTMLLPETPLKGSKRVTEKITELIDTQMPKFEGKVVSSSYVIAEYDDSCSDDIVEFIEDVKALYFGLKDKGRKNTILFNGSIEDSITSDDDGADSKHSEEVKEGKSEEMFDDDFFGDDFLEEEFLE